MSILKITSRNISLSESMRSQILHYKTKIEEISDRVTRCEVVVSAPHRRQRKGRTIHVSILLHIPKATLIVNREAEEDSRHEHFRVALHDAFHAIERQLEDRVRGRRDLARARRIPPVARIVRLDPSEEHGFFETENGEEIYFHCNSVKNGQFRDLKVGDRVRFSAEMGEKGPQAIFVAPVGKYEWSKVAA